MVNNFVFFLAVSIFSFQTFASTGTFIIVKNDIKILKKGGATETAKVGSSILVGDTVVSGTDSRAKIAMQDRNIITVLPNTKLTIEEYKTGEKNRNVKLSLLQGKVRNDVKEKYDNDKNKFQIRTPTAVAGVRGTKFVTGFSTETNATEILTLKGQVEVTKFELNQEKPLGTVVVDQGEKTTMANDSEPPPEPIKVPKVELRQSEQDTSAKKEDNSNVGDGQTAPPPGPPPPPPPRPSANRPSEGVIPPSQLPPFLINNPSNLPGKVKVEIQR